MAIHTTYAMALRKMVWFNKGNHYLMTSPPFRSNHQWKNVETLGPGDCKLKVGDALSCYPSFSLAINLPVCVSIISILSFSSISWILSLSFCSSICLYLICLICHLSKISYLFHLSYLLHLTHLAYPSHCLWFCLFCYLPIYLSFCLFIYVSTCLWMCIYPLHTRHILYFTLSL